MNRSFRRIVKHKRPKLQVKNPRLAPVIDIFENDESAIYLTGSPGYRVARGRSGLGYIETQAESARIQGAMIRWLFTGKFHKTKEPIVLFGMILAGAFLGGIPLLFILIGLFLTDNIFSILLLLIIDIPNIAMGVAILIGAVLSILTWNSKSITGD